MKKFILFTLLVLGIGSALFLSTKEIPAPNHTVEKVVSNERFLK